MLLRIEGLELEIQEDLFVCLDNGTTSRFCEWKRLAPGLQETFKLLEKELKGVIETFMQSDLRIAFDTVSEEYADGRVECPTRAAQPGSAERPA